MIKNFHRVGREKSNNNWLPSAGWINWADYSIFFHNNNGVGGVGAPSLSFFHPTKHNNNNNNSTCHLTNLPQHLTKALLRAVRWWRPYWEQYGAGLLSNPAGCGIALPSGCWHQIITNNNFFLFLFYSHPFISTLSIYSSLFTSHFAGRAKPAMCIGKALVRGAKGARAVPQAILLLHLSFHSYGGSSSHSTSSFTSLRRL